MYAAPHSETSLLLFSKTNALQRRAVYNVHAGLQMADIDESPPVDLRRAYVGCVKFSITSLKRSIQDKHALVA